MGDELNSILGEIQAGKPKPSEGLESMRGNASPVQSPQDSQPVGSSIFTDSKGNKFIEGVHHLKNGKPVLNGDGTFAKKRGPKLKKGGNEHIKSDGNKISEEKQSEAPNIEGTSGLVDPTENNKNIHLDHETALENDLIQTAKDWAKLEEQACITLLGSKKFDANTFLSVERCFESGMRKFGLKRPPWWAEIVLGQGKVIEYVAEQKTVQSRLKWLYRFITGTPEKA
jgi:hypothetical protein